MLHHYTHRYVCKRLLLLFTLMGGILGGQPVLCYISTHIDMCANIYCYCSPRAPLYWAEKTLSASKSRELPKLFTGLSKSINHELNTQKNQFPDPQQECCISVCVHNGPGWLLRITHKTSLQNCQSWEMSSLCYLTSTLSIYGFQTPMPVSKLWRSLFRTFNQTPRWKCLRLYRTSSTCWWLHLNTTISHLLLSVAL